MVVIVGYIASAFLAYSLVVNNALKFRWLNILGCISFIIYGILITAFPVILANSILLAINIFQLIKLFQVKEKFEFVPFKEGDLLIQKFLNFYKKDIQSYFPEFQFQNIPNDAICFVVLRDLAIANIFIATTHNNGNAEVMINYTVPQYRDYKVGKFIFERGKDYLLANNIQHIRYKKVAHEGHLYFLKVMGFEPEKFENTDCWSKHL